jgi:hypothetical protein
VNATGNGTLAFAPYRVSGTTVIDSSRNHFGNNLSLTGTVPEFDGVTTSGLGVPAIYFVGIGSYSNSSGIINFTVGGGVPPAGVYRASFNFQCTGGSGGGAGLIAFLNYHNGGVTRQEYVTPGVSNNDVLLFTSACAEDSSATPMFYTDGTTYPSWETVAVGGGTITYAVYATLERLY